MKEGQVRVQVQSDSGMARAQRAMSRSMVRVRGRQTLGRYDACGWYSGFVVLVQPLGGVQSLCYDDLLCLLRRV